MQIPGQVSLECVNCFSSCEITFEDDPPKVIHCPYCGVDQEVEGDYELDFSE